MRPSAISRAIKNCSSVDLPPFLWGPPGVGKSSLVQQVATEKGIPLIDLRAVLLDPVDLRGLPHVTKDGFAKWAIPDFLPKDGEGILFLDELLLAPQLTINACLQLILDRRLGEYKLPDGWQIVAASNNEGDRAGVHRMPTPLKSRFLHLNFEIHNNDWELWAVDNDIRSEVIAFLRFRPELLHKFDPQTDQKTFPCPRTWEFISRILNSEPDGDIERELYAGCVGEGAMSEWMGFLKTFRQIPDIDGILMNPTGAKVPDKNDPAVMYAVTTALARKADATNFDAVATYGARLPKEFCVYMVAQTLRRDQSITSCRAYTNWAVKHSDLLTGQG